MGKVLKRLPSPSMGVAFIALLAALGGTAVALPGSNTVTGGDITRGAVKSSDIGNNSVRGGDIRTSTLRGSDVGANTLTGSDINEGSLGTVPSANTANNANTAGFASSAGDAGTADSIGGVKLQRFSFAEGGVAPLRTILNLNGLTLEADCSGATLDFQARSAVAGAQVDGYSVQTDVLEADGSAEVANLVNVPNSVANAVINLVPNDEDDEVGSLRYMKPDGTGVTVEWHAAGNLPASGCFVAGVASSF